MTVLLALVVLLAGRGAGLIDVTEIRQGSVLNSKPATMVDGGKPVNGTIVKKDADGKVVEKTEYADGFPNGRHR